MGRADRWMRRGFIAIASIAVVFSTSWIAVPIGAHAVRSAERLVANAVGSVDGPDPATARAAPVETAAPSPGPIVTPAPPPLAAVALPSSPYPTSLSLPKDDTYIWPISGAKITTYFAPSRGATMLLNGVEVHNGIDIARPCGWPIAAAHDGTVLNAGRRSDGFLGFSGSVQPYYDELARRKLTDRVMPIMVIVDDGNGLISVYVHLAKASVKAGDKVFAGQLIGLEGATGNATGCHLHYSIYVADGPWVDVSPSLVMKWHYPAWMRLRIDPLLYLPADSPDAGYPSPGLEPPAERPQWVPPEPAAGAPPGME